MNWDTTNSAGSKGSSPMRLALWLLLAVATAIPSARTESAARPRVGNSVPWANWSNECDHGCRRRCCRTCNAHRGRRETRTRQGADSDWRHGDSSAPARQLGSRVRGHVQPERQWRHDRHQLDQGIRFYGGADLVDWNAQRGDSARCRGSMAIKERPRVYLHLSHRRRDV